MSLIIHTALCAALSYMIFCRAVRMDAKSALDVRFAFFALGVAAIMGMAVPFATGQQPSLFDLGFLAAVTLVQYVTSRGWHRGTPPGLRR